MIALTLMSRKVPVLQLPAGRIAATSRRTVIRSFGGRRRSGRARHDDLDHVLIPWPAAGVR